MNIKDSAKTIVCYGDSNTWGCVPGGDRYSRSVRWTGILQNLLGGEYEIINEGLSGRTFVALDVEKPERTGITHLKSILKTHKPVDAIVILLGTNDVRDIYNLEAQDIASHLEQTINLIQKEKINKILIVSPPFIVIPENGNLRPDFANRFNIVEKLSELFKKVAEKYKCNFINAQDYIFSSKVDGFHLDAGMHKKFAEVLKNEILSMKL